MELEDLASHFEKVRLNSRGFTACCPAHDDRSPSLTVAEGRTGWLVKCHAGCPFLDVARAAGLSPLAFKFGGTSSSVPAASSLDARRKLRELIGERRRIPVTAEEVVDMALEPQPRRFADATIRWYGMARLPFPDAMRMHVVFLDGFVFDVLGPDRWAWGRDWREAKRTIAHQLWVTFRDAGGVL